MGVLGPPSLNIMETLFKAERYSHGVRLTGYNREMFSRLTHFLEGLSLKEPVKNQYGNMVMELKKRYYGITEDYRELFIHRNTYQDLLNYLTQRGLDISRISEELIPAPAYAAAEYAVKAMYVLHDYQEIIVEELIDGLYSRRLDLQTGKGKTLSALAAVAKLKCRAIVMVAPKYFGIWEKALKETYEDIHGRYVEVSGSDDLKTLINRALVDDIPWDFIHISNVTYRTFIEAYEKYGEGMLELGWGCTPMQFHALIKAGVQINDEYQDDPALAYRIDMFTNVPKQIFLSATPFTGNPYVSKMIGVMLPPETLCTLPAYDAYAVVVALLYSDPGVRPTDYLTPYKNTYNHGRYETQMLKHKTRTANYYAMVKRIINGIFVREFQKGQRLLVLCATVAFIQKLTAYIAKEFPEFVVGEHTAGHDPAKLQTNDMTVSTIKSSGTGQDIINLKEVLLLQATGSERDTEQIKGRLRKLKGFPGLDVRLTYLVCMQIPQHNRYDTQHKKDFEGKCKSHRTMRLG